MKSHDIRPHTHILCNFKVGSSASAVSALGAQRMSAQHVTRLFTKISLHLHVRPTTCRALLYKDNGIDETAAGSSGSAE